MHEIVPILRHPFIMLFYVAVSASILGISVPLLLAIGTEALALRLRLPLIMLAMMLGLFLMVAQFRLIAWLQRGREVARIPVSVPLFFSILGGQTMMALFQMALLDTPLPPFWWFVLTVITHQVLSEVFIGFLIRRADRILAEVRAHRSDADPEPEPAGTGQLVAGNRRYALDRLLRLQAEGNYVRVVTEAGEDLVSGPLSELVAGLPDGLGALVHR